MWLLFFLFSFILFVGMGLVIVILLILGQICNAGWIFLLSLRCCISFRITDMMENQYIFVSGLCHLEFLSHCKFIDLCVCRPVGTRVVGKVYRFFTNEYIFFFLWTWHIIHTKEQWCSIQIFHLKKMVPIFLIF